MKKALITLSLAVLSCTPLAKASTSQSTQSNTDKWYKTINGEYAVQGLNSKTKAAVGSYAIIYKTAGVNRNVGFKLPARECETFKSTSTPIFAAKVNNQNINFDEQCIAKGWSLVYPRSEAGAKFLWDAFIKSKVVSVDLGASYDDLHYSAVGFQNATKQHFIDHDAL